MSSRVQVRVESGVLEGCVYENSSDPGNEYYSFQGIPYAKPPIGLLRFKPPVPVEPWEGVKNATEDGDQCYSRNILQPQQKLGSEDCLTLNVYTPKLPVVNGTQVSSELKPVMVFIHGGAYLAGSNSKAIYGPEYLLREDVILVAMNYRLGFLGFLSLDDPTLGVHGNAGLKDMVLALKWVKNNIKNFNGDPDNITIFGESAGASSIHLLVLSPLSKGLFHKAIAQSGCALNLWARCRELQPILSEILGIDSNDGTKLLHILQTMPVEELHALQDKLPNRWDISIWRPAGFTIENPHQNEQPFLTKDPVELLEKGEYHHVPLLVGFNSREGMLIHVAVKTPVDELIPDVEQNVPVDLELAKGSSKSKDVAQKIMKFYYNSQDRTEADIDDHYKLLSDNFFIREIYKFATKHSRSACKPLFFYEMQLETPINLFKTFSGITTPGVCHADDLSYLFKTPMHVDITPGSAEDIGIRRFCRLWTNFAKYGNPNPTATDPLLPVIWNPFTPEEEDYLEIGEELLAKKKPVQERMEFWKEIYACQNVIHKL